MNANFIQELRRACAGEVMDDRGTRGLYATDASIYQIEPVAVCCPRDEADVCAAVAVAAKHRVPILPRGGGTSLSGQTIGKALVLDFSKYMNQVLEINVEEGWARVQPGIVRDELNEVLKPLGFHFAPDPATANRCNVGGMIANNSSGTRSIVYGKTIDHVLSTRVLFADGEIADFTDLTAEQRATAAAAETHAARILRGVDRIVSAHRDAIEKAFPKVMRRVGGYNLDEFLQDEPWNLSKLFVGSEGTLCTLLEARVRLTPLPKHTGVCVVHYADLMEAIRSTVRIVEHGPSAVEILDEVVLRMAHENLSTRNLCSFIDGEPAAVLIVEFFGDTAEAVAGKIEGLIADLQAAGEGYAYPVFTDAAGQAQVWAVRRNGLGLMLGLRGARKPIPFIEDACVPLKDLPEYIEKVLAICREEDTPVTMYAHASVGVIHVRPLMDLKDQAHIDHMKRIAARTLDLVKHYGGSWSGEHGDGHVRSPFMEAFFGSEVYGALKEVKALFDPEGLMNPGNIIDAPPMDQDLRYGPDYEEPTIAPFYKYRDDGSFSGAVDMCAGVGACRKTLGGTMCPSYMATRDEKHSTRGRANALRLAMSGQWGPDGMASQELHEILDLCISCKACKSECPSNVDMAKLKGEFLQYWYDTKGSSRRDRVVAASADMARRIAGPLAPLVNGLQRSALGRTVLEAALGLDRRRVAPSFARRPFADWFDGRSSKRPAATRGKVVLFDDTFLSFYEPQIGMAAVDLLESCGYEVLRADAGCCQRTRLSHGFLRDAKRLGTRTMLNLDRYAQDGLPILCCEPSCAASLTDDLPDLIDDSDLADRVAAQVMMIDVFLARELKAGRLDVDFESVSAKMVVHGHCNQKALYGTDGMHTVLGRVEGLEFSEVDSGCCGMAGSFGYEKEHYDVSMRMGAQRLFPAVRAASDATVLACGFSCRHQLRDATGVDAKHFVEVVRVASSEWQEMRGASVLHQREGAVLPRPTVR